MLPNACAVRERILTNRIQGSRAATTVNRANTVLPGYGTAVPIALCHKGVRVLKRKPEPAELATSADAFGELMRDLRETAAVSQAKLAAAIPCDRSHIARIEAGTRVPQKQLVERSDEVLDTGGILLRLWRKIDWYPVVEHPDWFKRRASMDAEAIALREYGTQVIPGLLQAKPYVRALFARLPGARTEDVEERVAARLSRQHRFLDPDGPLLLAVLDESCIRVGVGSSEVMHAQCAHLLALGAHPNIRIQVAPFSRPALVRPNTATTLITLPGGDEWVYSESLDRGHLTDDPAVFNRHLRAYDVLRADVLPVDESAALIREAMEGYADDERPRPAQRHLGQEQLQRRQRRQLRRGGPRLYGRRPRP